MRAILVGIVPRLFHAVNDPARKNCFKTTLKWKKSIFHDVFKNKLSVYDLKFTPTNNRTHIWLYDSYCIKDTVLFEFKGKYTRRYSKFPLGNYTSRHYVSQKSIYGKSLVRYVIFLF